ncbi:MAG: hypothetical protein NTZ09_00195 [Candidatus Hydrogenedentes bacterium]|nr:hypothetical protein [Candidatus Hydrogenedentota bacterium]
MGFLLVLKAEFVRNMIVMRRYWFRTVTGMIIGYFMLMSMIMMFHSKGGVDPTGFASKFSSPEQATKWALCFIVGMLAFGIVGLFSQGLQGMAQSGQLEQLCMSPHGLVSNFMARSLMAAVTSVPTSALMVWLIAYRVGFPVPMNTVGEFATLVLLLMLAFLNLIGFGFMVGGLVLVFKQTGQVAVIVRMGLLGIAVMADEVRTFPKLLGAFAHTLPITDATLCLIHLVIRGQMQPVYDAKGEPLMEGGKVVANYVPILLHPSFLLLLVNCAAWTFVGIACFRLMENWSRNKGTLGAY